MRHCQSYTHSTAKPDSAAERFLMTEVKAEQKNIIMGSSRKKDVSTCRCEVKYLKQLTGIAFQRFSDFKLHLFHIQKHLYMFTEEPVSGNYAFHLYVCLDQAYVKLIVSDSLLKITFKGYNCFVNLCLESVCYKYDKRASISHGLQVSIVIASKV